MEIYGRNLLDYNTKIDLSGVDELVFYLDGKKIVISLYRARHNKEFVEVRTIDGELSIRPRAANVVHVYPTK